MTAASVASPTAFDRGQRVVLPHVSWDTYERLLADHADRSAPRFTYDRGVLEIVAPSSKHEKDNRTLAQVVELVAEELGVEYLPVGSMTFRRADLQQGFEPDSGFYLQSEARVRDRERVDPDVDPPPDLVIEIEVAHPSLDKLPLLARMGVPEVWRFDGQRVTILTLEHGAYHASAASVALPPLTSDALTRFLAESRSLRTLAWIRTVRAWAREQRGAGDPTA
jgi:Uma2 family endonuclease